jgi:hypothetical protein
MTTNPTDQDLRSAGCLFSTDRVGGPKTAAFKRAARWSQHRWAVDELGITKFGTHKGREKGGDGAPVQVLNGTKLTEADAAAGENFLSEAIHDVVEQRLQQRGDEVKFQTLEPTRLRRDLLSSMPMAFNLFGEASLHPESRDALAVLFGVAAGPSDIVFEWSPGRRDRDYTRDRTAFDVALRIGDPREPRTVVGIETKYHEHSALEAMPKGSTTYEGQTAFLVTKANASGVFVDGWQGTVLDSDLRQIWRDHLLALSMRDHDQWSETTRYVLIYPSANPSFASAVERYAAQLKPGDNSFASFTIEDVLDAAFAHGGPTKDKFHRRYLAWMGGAE